MLITEKQLLAHLQVSRNTLNHWRKEGLPYLKLGRRLIRYKLEDVERWIEQHRRAADGTSTADLTESREAAANET